MTISEKNEAFRRITAIVFSAIFGGGFLAALIGVVYVLGTLAERLQP